MLFGRDSSRSTWRWFSCSSAASSIVMMRWSSGTAVDRAFRSVVLPEPVPPEIRMFSSARMQLLRKSTVVSDSVPILIMSSRFRRVSPNLRMVTSGPLSDSGGMIAFTRLPSGRRASTIGDDSSMRRPICATILLMMRRRCDESAKWIGTWYRRPARSTQMSWGPLTMISVMVSSSSNRSSGPWPRMSSVTASAMETRSVCDRPASFDR